MKPLNNGDLHWDEIATQKYSVARSWQYVVQSECEEWSSTSFSKPQAPFHFCGFGITGGSRVVLLVSACAGPKARRPGEVL